MFDNKRWEALKEKLFLYGIEAIEDFCDMDIEYDDNDVIDNLLDMIAENKSIHELECWCRNYNI